MLIEPPAIGEIKLYESNLRNNDGAVEDATIYVEAIEPISAANLLGTSALAACQWHPVDCFLISR